jgi:hypothetical protein
MTTVTVGGLVMGQPTVDDYGVTWWHQSISGWRDGTGMRTNFTDRPQGAGAYDGPAYPDKRVIVISGTLRAPDNPGRARAMRRLAACLADGSMGQLTVADDLGTLMAFVRRSDKPTITMAGTTWCDYSLQFTAPEPRLVATDLQAATTLMAQSGAGGVAWNGTVPVLNSNSTFEATTDPWAATSGTLAWSAARAHSGTYSAQITPTGSAATAAIQSELVPVVAGKTYRARTWAWFTNAVTSNYSPSIAWYNSAGTLISTSSSAQSVPAATWTQVDVIAAAPTGAVQARMVPTLSGTPAAAQVWYVDDATLRLNPTGTEWNGPTGTTGLSWGQPSDTGSVVVDNLDGTAEADLLITITGPCSNPSVSTSDSWITYQGDLSATDVLEINTGTGSVRLNGMNRRPLLRRAQWFTALPGEQLAIRFTCEGTQNAQATMTVQWRVSYA